MISITPTVNGALFVFLALNMDLNYSASKIGKLLFVCTSPATAGIAAGVRAQPWQRRGCYRRPCLGMTHTHMTSGSNEAIQCKQFARRGRKRAELQGKRVECRNDKQPRPKYSSLFVI